MNCKPGELAIIVKKEITFKYKDIITSLKYPVGLVVKVLKVTPSAAYLPIAWEIEGIINLHGAINGSEQCKFTANFCHDDVLKPLRGFEDDESINFSIVKQEEVTA